MKKIVGMLGMALALAGFSSRMGTRLAVPFWIEPAPEVTLAVIPPVPVKAAVAPVPPPPSKGGPLDLVVTPSRTRIARPGELYVHIALRAPGGATTARRVPTDWALVVDRSGSMMARGKIKHARAAAAWLAAHLASGDRLSIVGFDHVAELVRPLNSVDDAATTAREIEGLFPRGSTNLLEGLKLGLTTLDPPAAGRARRVIFLTDGMDSQGDQNANAIRELAREAGLKGTIITTVGMGAEFQEDLLLAMADASGGRYFYLEDPAQMARIYQGELAVDQAAVATDVTLQLTPSANLQSAEVLGMRFVLNGGALRFPIGTIRAGEQRNLLVKLKVKSFEAGTTLPAIEVRAAGKIAGTSGTVDLLHAVSLETVADEAAAEATVDATVLALVEKFTLARQVEQAMDLVAAGKRQEAQSLLQERLRELQQPSAPVAGALKSELKSLEGVVHEVSTLSTDSETVSGFVKQQKWNAYQWRR